MLANKERLENRSISGNTKWFEFGRSQGLVNMNKEKLNDINHNLLYSLC